MSDIDPKGLEIKKQGKSIYYEMKNKTILIFRFNARKLYLLNFLCECIFFFFFS